MKEHPIIFNTDMVKAILEGRKTQTRSVCKDQSPEKYWFGKNLKTWPDGKDLYTGWVKDIEKIGIGIPSKCPYGQVGDRLWVRESYRIESFMDGVPLEFGYRDGSTMEEKEDYIGSGEYGYDEWFERIAIQSTEDAEKAFKNKLIGQDKDGCFRWNKGNSPCRWRPSIHMPRWASRITLEITDVRVERLQKISASDMLREGQEIYPIPVNFGEFRELWNSIHKKEYRWEDNPWVWVITFKRI